MFSAPSDKVRSNTRHWTSRYVRLIAGGPTITARGVTRPKERLWLRGYVTLRMSDRSTHKPSSFERAATQFSFRTREKRVRNSTELRIVAA